MIDHETNTEADAGRFEAAMHRRPSRLELAEERGFVDEGPVPRVDPGIDSEIGRAVAEASARAWQEQQKTRGFRLRMDERDQRRRLDALRASDPLRAVELRIWGDMRRRLAAQGLEPLPAEPQAPEDVPGTEEYQTKVARLLALRRRLHEEGH